MTVSMRRQTAKEKQRAASDEKDRDKRMKAVSALRNGALIARSARSSGVSRTTCSRISTAMKRGDK